MCREWRVPSWAGVRAYRRGAPDFHKDAEEQPGAAVLRPAPGVPGTPWPPPPGPPAAAAAAAAAAASAMPPPLRRRAMFRNRFSAPGLRMGCPGAPPPGWGPPWLAGGSVPSRARECGAGPGGSQGGVPLAQP